MSFAFYIYTTIIMGVALVTSAVALVVWLMTRRRDSLVAAAGFLLYMLDMSVIFFDEYNRLKYDYAVTFSEPLQHPLLRCVLGIAIYACVVLWMFARLRKNRRHACSDSLSCRFQSCNCCWCLAAALPERCSSISFGSRVTWAM